MASTPYQTSDAFLRAADLVAVATTTPTSSSPYGFTLAQATAIITGLNAVIALLKAEGDAVINA